MKFAWIAAERVNWPVRPMCRVLGVSPSGSYTWRTRPESSRKAPDRRLGVLVRASREKSRATYGSPGCIATFVDRASVSAATA